MKQKTKVYRLFFRLVFSRIDPETAHSLAFLVIRLISLPVLRHIVRVFTRPGAHLAVTTLGLSFPSTFGLAAGFDKSAHGILGLAALGFGHIEVGTITALPQPGNPRPRLFRLVKDRALINRMGFNNPGAKECAIRLAKYRKLAKPSIIGVNIGKSRAVPLEETTQDYRISTRLLSPHADYLVVNVSSPNTPGLRGLQEREQLAPLLRAVQEEAANVPVLVKISPDLTDNQVLAIASLVRELNLAGVVATNTTLSRAGLISAPKLVTSAGAGGLSGYPLAQRSLALLSLLREALGSDVCIISVGGVRNAQDVRERLAAGATLVQGYTEFVYTGPSWPRKINRELS